jgi:hypothetical protein
MYPNQAGWTIQNMLLAELVDVAHWLQWAKTKDGQRNRNRPPPVPRPGVGTSQRPGLQPKAAPLSVIKERFKVDNDDDRAARLKAIFSGR